MTIPTSSPSPPSPSSNTLTSLFTSYLTNPIQRRLLKEAGITSPADPQFSQIIVASLDFVNHAETFLPDPNNPTVKLHLEQWQKHEIRYAQYGEAYLLKLENKPLDAGFDSKGVAIRKPIAINSPRGFGKSVFSSITAVEFALHFPYTKIALFSTSQDQANDLMEKVRYNIKHSIYAFMINPNIDSKTHLGLINGSEIKAFPQSEVTIRGYHPHIKIIDEKARIKREILESAIRPMGRKVCWLEIGISTPFGRNNNHYEDCVNTAVFHSKLLKALDVSWVDAEKLARERKMMGDRVARQELDAEFIEDADSVFKPSWIDSMLDFRLNPQKNGEVGVIYFMGIDFGKHRDYTAISIGHQEKDGDVKVDLLERYLHLDYMKSVDRAYELSKVFNVRLVIPDGSGVGAPVLEQLESKLRIPIYQTKVKTKRDLTSKAPQYRLGFIFTNTSKLNLVGEAEKVLMNGKLHCPHHYNTTDPRNDRFIFKVLENEMIDFTYTRTTAGNITFSHPDDNKSHDDTLMAVMLMLWGIKYGKVVSTKIGGSPTFRTPKADRIPNRNLSNQFTGIRR